jgi:hypothetical protein
MIGNRLQNRRYTSWAIALLAKRNFHPEKSWSIILKWLEEGTPDEVFHTVWILKGCALSGFDLSETIPGLEKAMSSKSWRTRVLASDTISSEYIRIGKEKELAFDESIYEKEKLDSYWDIIVRHRRKYSLNDDPIAMHDYYVALHTF